MAEQLTLRSTTRADLAVVDALLTASYPALLKHDYPPSVMVTALPLISRAQPALLSSGTYYLIEDQEGAALAVGGWTAQDKEGRGRIGDVRHVATHPTALRRGLAGAIMRHAFETARTAGIRQMMCQSSRTAVPFYASLGFTILGDIHVPLRPGIIFPAIRMVRRL